jgi:hypothetical protein
MTRKSTQKYEVVHITSGVVMVTGVSKTNAKASVPPDKHRFMVRPVKRA